jgi:hypothetical protein
MRDDVASRREPEACRRLFFLATSFAMRGMKKEAYTTALYYVEGPGRGKTWAAAPRQGEKVGGRNEGSFSGLNLNWLMALVGPASL